MIRVYWPGKAVQSWLQKIELSGTSDGVPRIRHEGFGLIIKVNDRFLVWRISGFMAIDGAGMSIRITGQRRGVHVYLSFRQWISAIRHELATRPTP